MSLMYSGFEHVVPLPEVREMVEAALAFMRDEESVIGLWGAAANCAEQARRYRAHPELRALAERWELMALELWNEWGFFENPPPRNEVCAQLLADLGVSP